MGNTFFLFTVDVAGAAVVVLVLVDSALVLLDSKIRSVFAVHHAVQPCNRSMVHYKQVKLVTRVKLTKVLPDL